MMTYRIKRILNLTAVLCLLTGLGISSAQAAPSDHFVTTWKTDNPGSSNDTSITVPMVGGSYDVDWDNDGVLDEFWLTGPVTHDFGVAGTYTIRIAGSYSAFSFANAGDKQKIVSLDQWGTQTWTTMYAAFAGCSNLEIPATDTPDFSAVTDMYSMFERATAANPDTSGWDTSAVTRMSYMFQWATAANPNTSSWDTSSVTSMRSMFREARSANPDTGGWDTSAVTNMSYMFYHATSANPDTGGWNTSAVTNMSYMFYSTPATNPDTSGWDTSAVTNMSYMFIGATAANPDTSGWDTSAVTNMAHMFRRATAANPNTSSWDTSAVTNMTKMFYEASSANPDTSGWITSAVTNMSNMFYDATSANPDTGGWNTSAVTNMSYMFYRARSADPDTGGWDTSAVTDMSYMFTVAESANPDTSGWDTSAVRSMYRMFYAASLANPDTSGWDVSGVVNMSYMFTNAKLSEPNYEALLINWNAQALQRGVTFNGGNSTYCSNGAANARANMINSDGWTITDGGQECAGPTPRPTVVTSSASSIGTTGARLNGSADPNGASTSAWFQWGTSTGYGNATAPRSNVGSGTSSVPYYFNIGALACDTTYHFRAVAYNNGGTAYGTDGSFTTSACSTPSAPDIAVGGSGNFGDVEVDTNSSHTVTINNTGNADLIIGDLNGLATPFSVVSDICSGVAIAPDSSCTLSVRFAPVEIGLQSDTLIIPSNDPDKPNFFFGVNGTGTAVPVPNIAVSGSGAFGEVEVDTTSNRSFNISNSGNAALKINSIGGLAAPFSIVSNNCSSSLAAGTSCTFNVQFAPAEATGETDTVVINSDDPDQPNVYITVSGTGTAVPVPNIAVSGSGAFGNVEVDTTSNRSFSISNSGNAALKINSIGGLAAPFSIVSNNCGSSLAKGTSCTFNVQFAPAEATGETDTVVINSDDPDQPNVYITVSGTGTAVPVPNIAVGGSGAFGEVEVDTISNRSFSISNSGNAALKINSIGGLAAPFSIVSNNCGSSLAKGTSCTFNVQFAPAEATGETDTVVINSDDPDQPNVYITVSGTGTAVPVPNIAVGGSGAFGEVEVDTISNRSFSISNSGNAALKINSIGGLAAPFSIVSNNCGSSLTTGTSCTFNVQFAPAEATGETDTVVINSDDPDQPNVNITVSGTGTAVPVPNIAVSGSGAFGEVEVDTTSNRSFSISNSGNAALKINSIGGLAAPFSIVSNNCGSSLTTGTSCTFNVQFAPAEATGETDTVVINSDDPDQPNVNIPVSGTGTAVPVPNIAVSGSGVFGEVEVDTTSNRSFSISNSGNAALTINSIGGLAAPFTIVSNNCGSSLTAGTSCTFNVQFAPTEATGETDTVVINSDDPDQPNVYITVSGTGTAVPVPNIAVSGSGVFGEVEVDTTSNRSFSISNSGNAALTINSIGGLAAPFTIVSNNCGSSLAAGTSCTFLVQFAPTEATGETDTVVINSDDPDQPNVYITVSGTGTSVPPQGEQVEIISTGFENGNAEDWILDGGIDVNSTEAIGQYSLRHRKSATSVLNISTVGYSGVNVTMHLAASSLEQGDGCYAEALTNDGNSWTSIVELHDGNDDGTFYSATVSPPGADNNANLKLRFRSTGQHKSDYCWGDEVTVMGIPGDAILYPDIAVSGNGEFGNVDIGASSTHILTISNIGDAELAIENISDLAAPFTIESDSCSITNLSPAGSCELSVSFSPTTTGPQSDTLIIPSNDPDQPDFSLDLSGTGTDNPGQDVVIVDVDFEDSSTDGWTLSGSVAIDGILAIDNYSLRHTKTASSVFQVSTIGYSDVSITMHIAATSLDNGEACYAEVSTDGGSSWITVAQILSGDDDGVFISGTISPASADDNPDVQLRFISNGAKKPDYCYGDNVTVSGTLN